MFLDQWPEIYLNLIIWVPDDGNWIPLRRAWQVDVGSNWTKKEERFNVTKERGCFTAKGFWSKDKQTNQKIVPSKWTIQARRKTTFSFIWSQPEGQRVGGHSSNFQWTRLFALKSSKPHIFSIFNNPRLLIVCYLMVHPRACPPSLFIALPMPVPCRTN